MILLIAAGVCVAGAVVGHATGKGGAWGRLGARLVGGGLIVVTANTPMGWREGRWKFTAPGGGAAIVCDRVSLWRPSSSTVSMLASTAPRLLVTARITTIPLWPVAGVLAGLGALAWARAGRAPAGHECAACGYDLRGLSGGCPECGAGAVV
jgi:hypothetical protein